MATAIPAIVLGLAALAWWKHGHRGMTPERQVIYEGALKSKTLTPAQYRQLADEFAKQGLSEQASLLRKRAALRELPPPQKEARRAAFKKGMASKDPLEVEKLAKAFADEGATDAAAKLRDYADGLKTAQKAGAAPKPTYADGLKAAKP